MLDDPELMKMEQVLTDSLVELPLNLEGDPFTVQTSDLRTLVVPTLIVEQSRDLPDALKTGNLLVKYRAKHPTVVLAPAQNPDDVDLMLPDTHLEALLYFIASRLHTPVGMTNEGNLPNIWYSKYQAECMKLE